MKKLYKAVDSREFCFIFFGEIRGLYFLYGIIGVGHLIAVSSLSQTITPGPPHSDSPYS
ncbi:hypothetical protein LCGC14_2916120, partial [marine sediment metagenome]